MRRPLFQLGTRTKDRLQALRLAHPRMFGMCQDLLMRIGQHCVDKLIDEVGDLRRFAGGSRWRVLRRRIDLLLAFGALELTPWGYAPAFFRDDNLPAAERAKRNAETRSRDRAGARSRRLALTSTQKTIFPKENAGVFSASSETDLLGVPGSQNPTHKSPARPDLRAKIVPAEKSVVSEQTPPYDFEAAARRRMGRGSLLLPGLPLPDLTPVGSGQAGRPAPMRPHRAARMPLATSPANFGTVTQALRDLEGDVSQAESLFAELWRQKATDVEVGYAVWNVKRQRALGRRVAHPVAYLLRVIENQRRYRAA